jgi:hypothetical protein
MPGGLDLIPADGTTQQFGRLHVAAGQPVIQSHIQSRGQPGGNMTCP